MTGDTIAAVATPAGRGGIGVVRVSGPSAAAIAEALLGARPLPRFATRARFRDAARNIIDDGIALWFPAPGSYTGEDVLELQGHGGPVVLEALLGAVVGQGARVARPGEFSERAFLNGKLDLTQAEAVADLIDASTRAAARAARRSLSGALSERAGALRAELTALQVRVEGSLDFSDEEDVASVSAIELGSDVASLAAAVGRVIEEARAGNRLRHGVSVAIVGRPNVGKSSLLNALVGEEAAIVAPVPGTTRDTVREHIDLDGVPVRIVDTAGIRETDDPVESIGVERARRAADQADLALHVQDDSSPDAAADRRLEQALKPARIVVRNKVDLSGARPGTTGDGDPPTVYVSATTGAGLPALVEAIREQIGLAQDLEGLYSARARHLDALAHCLAALERAEREARAEAGLELVAEELRLASRALGELTGELTTEALLGEIFSTFCIGK